jgi:hypothetical protein
VNLETALYGKPVNVTTTYGERRKGKLYRILTDQCGRPVFEVDFGFGPQRLASGDRCVPAAKAHHLTWEECLKRYPRICLLVADVLIGSASEAACCLRDYRDGHHYGSEAVSHSGLSPFDRVYAAVNRWRAHRFEFPDIYRRLVQRKGK